MSSIRAILQGRESVALCLAAMLFFAISDVIAKHLTASVHPLQIGWFRYLAAATLFLILCLRHGRPAASVAAGPQILRGFGMAGATVFLVMALRLQPMAEATALVFLSPAFVTILSVLLLGERVEKRRWVGVAGGFLGVMLILRPGLSTYNPASLLALLSAGCWATAMIMTRKAVIADHLMTTLAYSTFTGFSALSLSLPLVYGPVDSTAGLVAAVMALFWLAAHVAIALAYKRTEARVSRLAPLSYTHMVWAVLLGLVVFGFPSGWVHHGGMCDHRCEWSVFLD